VQKDLHGINFPCGGCDGTIELNKQAGLLPLWLLMQRHNQKRQRQEEVNQTERIQGVFAAFGYCNAA